MKYHIYSSRFKKLDEKLREAQFGQFIDEFASQLLLEGYPKKTLRNRFLVIKALNQWLIKTKLDLKTLDSFNINQFIKYRLKNNVMIGRGELVTLNKFITLLRSKAFIPSEKLVKKKKSLIEEELSTYKNFLITEKGLSLSTISRYLGLNEKFLKYIFDNHPIDYQDISSQDIIKFIKKFACKNSICSSRMMVGSIRSFLNFLVYHGEINHSLVECIPGIPNRRLTTIPYYLSEKDLSHLLICSKGKTPAKRRNYSILLLLSRLGLRASEIVKLSLDDINWEQGEIIIQGKGYKQVKYPLPADIGRSLVAYLKYVRPHSANRRVFFTIRPPYRPFKNGVTVSTIVKRALITAGLNPKKKGAHLLRHTLATECLRKGASLIEISEILGHESIDTTAIYAKVDFAQLRTLTMPWPIPFYDGGAK